MGLVRSCDPVGGHVTSHMIACVLGLSHLLGTNLLKAYMHGFFMDMTLYHKVRGN